MKNKGDIALCSIVSDAFRGHVSSVVDVRVIGWANQIQVAFASKDAAYHYFKYFDGDIRVSIRRAVSLYLVCINITGIDLVDLVK